MDLHDLHDNTRDGLHMASLAGAWSCVAGFGGLRDHDGELSFDPALPAGIERIAFAIRWRDSLVDVTVDRTAATYRLRSRGQATVLVRHAGVEVEVGAHPVSLPLRPRPERETPTQPVGREPMRRVTTADELRKVA